MGGYCGRRPLRMARHPRMHGAAPATSIDIAGVGAHGGVATREVEMGEEWAADPAMVAAEERRDAAWAMRVLAEREGKGDE